MTAPTKHKQTLEGTADLFEASAHLPLIEGAASGDFCLVKEFFPQPEADALFADLLDQVQWRKEYLRLFGRRVQSPRRVAWYGEPGTGYVYSGQPHEASGWLPLLEELRERLVKELHSPFNFVLANFYEDQNDSMGWHSDNEPELGAQPVIASVSLGAERTFRVRSLKKLPGQRRTSCPIVLGHGSLMIMRGASQTKFQHALPKATRTCGPRINLTFRYVHSHTHAYRHSHADNARLDVQGF